MMTAILLNSVMVIVVGGWRSAVGDAALRAAVSLASWPSACAAVAAVDHRHVSATARSSNDRHHQRQRDPVAALTEMEHQLARAVVSGDREGWSKFVDPDWRVTHIDGQVLTKAQVLDMVFGKTPGPLVENAVDEIEVRLFGEAAVVTGRTTAQSREGVRVVLRFTDFVLMRNGRWQVVASQATALPKTKD